MRAVLTALFLLTSCTHGADPLPPRAPRYAVPKQVEDHPGFYLGRGEAIELEEKKPEKPRPSPCSRECPKGQHCEIVHGLDTCVPDAD